MDAVFLVGRAGKRLPGKRCFGPRQRALIDQDADPAGCNEEIGIALRQTVGPEVEPDVASRAPARLKLLENLGGSDRPGL